MNGIFLKLSIFKRAKSMVMVFVFIMCAIPIFAATDAGEPATITSDRMKILSKGEVSDFIGHVKLVHKNLTINSDEMKMNEKSGDASGSGNIYINYSSGTTVTNVWGNAALYNRNTGNGTVTGDVKVKRELTPGTTDVLNLTCDKLEIFNSGERLHAVNNVKIFKTGTEAYGNDAFYEHKNNELLLTGRPAKIKRVDGKTVSEYSGDKVHIDINTEAVTITGNVKTKVVLE